VLVELNTTRGTLTGLTVELLRGGVPVAEAYVGRVGVGHRRVVLRTRAGRALRSGRYTLLVRRGRRMLVRRGVHLGA
jgi:hypothetical protein